MREHWEQWNLSVIFVCGFRICTMSVLKAYSLRYCCTISVLVVNACFFLLFNIIYLLAHAKINALVARLAGFFIWIWLEKLKAHGDYWPSTSHLKLRCASAQVSEWQSTFYALFVWICLSFQIKAMSPAHFSRHLFRFYCKWTNA